MINSLNRVEISLPALCHNFSLLKKLSQGSQVLAMVKADAYGHGMVECARALAETGADCFGVAEAIEGVRLRQAGICQPIYIMAGILPEIIPALFEYNLTPVVVDGGCFEELSRQAVQREERLSIVLKVDAGMGRQGVLPAQARELVELIHTFSGLHLIGLIAHLPMADDPESVSTPAIIKNFSNLFKEIEHKLPDNNKLILSLANSGGILYFPESLQDMIRPGISLYGCFPDGSSGSNRKGRPGLQPVMQFSSRIIQVKEVPAGTGLGYGHSFVTTRPTRIASIPAGYEDGYLRTLSNRGYALIHKKRVPVVGRISMNLTMFDVTDIGDVFVGDKVVLLGQQGALTITADEIAQWMNTINYEVLCLFGNLNNRVYVTS